MTIAPAAAETICAFLDDTGTGCDDYDLILTGDLGYVGSQCLRELMAREGRDIAGRQNDCGLMIFDRNKQDVHSGGSGCGCSASVLCSSVIPNMLAGNYKNVLFVATGALMSPVSAQQGRSIPAIAHLVQLTV